MLTPDAADRDLENIPTELKELDQWLLWRYEEREGKRTKVPHNARTGRKATKFTDGRGLSSFDTAYEAWRREPERWHGLGFVFFEDDELAGVDFDGCIEDGELSPWTAQWLERFDGAYAELSPSGTGLHILCRGKAPNRNNQKHGVEAYSSRRFFTVTGKALRSHAGHKLPNCQDAIDALAQRYFRAKKDNRAAFSTPTEPVDVGDAELMEKARRAGRGMGAKFVKLHDYGDLSDFGGDHSAARFWYLWNAGYWTGHDPERMSRWYESSALISYPGKDYRRKWRRLGAEECKRAIDAQPKAYRPRAVREQPKDKQRDVLIPYLALLLDTALWKGQKAATAYKCYAALILMAAERGITDDAEELRVGADLRSIAEKAGTSRQTLGTSTLPYLVQELKLVKWRPGAGNRSGEFVLPRPDASPVLTIKKYTLFNGQKCGQTVRAFFNGDVYGDGLDALAKLIRMRSGCSHTGRAAGLGKMHKVARLGMRAMFCMVTLLTTPRGFSADELASRMDRQKNHVVTTMRKLVEKGIVEEPHHHYFVFAEGFWAEYEKELRRSLIVHAEREQKRQHKRERDKNERKLKQGRVKWDKDVIDFDARRRKMMDEEARRKRYAGTSYENEQQKRAREGDEVQANYERMVEERMANLEATLRGGL